MAYASLVGKNSKVSLGANTVLGMGTWTIGGGSVATLDDTEFGDEYQDLVLGLLRDVVRTEENVTAQLRAAELVGRACALFTDVVETKQARDPVEIEREIRKLLATEDSANAA